MGRYLIRRAIISIFTLIAISIVVYTILALAPGDPLSGFANNPNVPPELRERIRKTMGLEDPIHCPIPEMGLRVHPRRLAAVIFRKDPRA